MDPQLTKPQPAHLQLTAVPITAVPITALMDAHRLRLSGSVQAGWLMIEAHGIIDVSTAAMLRTRLRQALDDHLLVAIDLSDAQLADASAVAVLVGTHRHATRHSKVFILVAPDHRASATLRTTGLYRRLLICPTVEDFLTWNGSLAASHGHGAALPLNVASGPS